MNKKRGWVFCKEGTTKEIGFAEPEDFLNAEIAVEKCDFGEHFDLYFRDSNGELNPVGSEEKPEDFV